MQENLEKKTNFQEKIKDFYKLNKIKDLFLFIIVIFNSFFFFF